ncbi:MAG TPA: aminomethyl-transferring glycine dehydrogenase [Usitatibacter sp.]|jgi:glycine dehydrogenase|nr:aminomethyl-transferring glycine dehydrogenase [Usitatibacter sp.]
MPDTVLHPAPTLAELEDHSAFVHRHIGPGKEEQAQMLALLGFSSRAEMIDAVVPAAIRRRESMGLGPRRDEAEALERLHMLARGNQVFRSYIGQGYFGTFTPGVIQRNVLESPSWYTAYTPYQPEIAQGRLEALVNFQTMVADLTGMAIANASMLDEATAAAEAMTLCLRSTRASSRLLAVADDVLPQTIAVLRTRAEPLGIDVRTMPPAELAQAEAFAVLVQYPGVEGDVRDYRALAEPVHARGGFVIAAADLLALTLLEPPGAWGADVVVGSAQRFGVPMGYGGPHAGFFATRDELKRGMPGRLVGVTVDAQGRPAYRLALQTREQHIRREKATSNICTAQVLLAVIASMYAVYHGPRGLERIARRTHRLACILRAGLERLGHAVGPAAFFDTVQVRVGGEEEAIVARSHDARMNFRRAAPGVLGISLDETTTRGDVERIWSVFSGRAAPFSAADLEAGAHEAIPQALARTTPFLTHPVFNRHHSETEMLRYLRRLADRDVALDRSMIPLGSCTMKLNATSEMLPISWPQFAHLHPFAPAAQCEGYRRLAAELEHKLARATGYAAVSLQPNAGSQGEYAGLLAIRAWHRSRGEGHRNVCLIPSSAHGTNPASAHMAGFEVVVVGCDDQGNVDVEDLRRKAGANGARLAALMVTYPSTHGVFEGRIREICDIVHQHGGQVYIDGANMNAMVGLCAPGEFGGDVSHLNLHKTFCIPHGGGGPGVGPIAVAAHLAPFLPGAGAKAIGAVSAAPLGSASILPISWMYMEMMGEGGLTAASEVAILNANYVARRLAAHYPVLYSGPGGLVAHECILDLRPLKETSGIQAEDVAKRLIDYGFHAPTMSFPVPGTLMVEPTESESKAELDRFCDAMMAIREEIRAIEEGRMDREDNPLRHAPHTAAVVGADTWTHAYSREMAAYPVPSLREGKYWPAVGRADNVYGDRNLFCTCPPVD